MLFAVNFYRGLKNLTALWICCLVRGTVANNSTNNFNSTEETCGITNYQAVKGKLLDNYDNFDSLYALPFFAFASGIPKFTRTINSMYVPSSGSECSNLRALSNTVNSESCPSRLVMNRDTNRVPCVLWEMKCLCQNCILPVELRIVHRPLKCSAIHRYVPVMRRTSIQSDNWAHTLEPVAVGCSCSGSQHTVFASAA